MKKNLIRTAAIIISMVMLMAVCGCAQQDTVGHTEDEYVFSPISISAKPVESEYFSDSGELIMTSSVDSITVSGGGKGAAEAVSDEYALRTEAINESIENEIQYLKEYGDEIPADTGHSWQMLTARAGRSDTSVFTLNLLTEAYSKGAAHGMYFYESINFDPHTGVKLNLSDLGVDGKDPTEELAGLLAGEYMNSEYQSDYSLTAEEAYTYISGMLGRDYNYWYISEDSFVLICNVYELASYASGCFEIKLPAYMLNGIIDGRWIADESADTEQQGTAERIFSVKYSENTAGRFSSMYIADIDGGESNVVWFSGDMTRVKVIPIEFADDGAVSWASDPEAVFDSVKSGEGILLHMTIPETIPRYCISAVDASGEQHVWAITYNGFDGGIAFVDLTSEAEG